MNKRNEFFLIMTVQKPYNGGYQSGAFKGIGTTEQVGRTRAEMLTWMLGQLPAELQGGNIVFFSAEPNHPAPATPAAEEVEAEVRDALDYVIESSRHDTTRFQQARDLLFGGQTGQVDQ